MELLHVQIMLCYAIDLLRAVTEDCKLQLILRPSRDANEDTQIPVWMSHSKNQLVDLNRFKTKTDMT